MSNISRSNIVGKIFNPIVTDISYETLEDILNNNESINVPDAILFSIPKENNVNNKEFENDKFYEGSIWLTDTDGYLYPMTTTFNRIIELEKQLENISKNINNINTRQLKSIKWNEYKVFINLYNMSQEEIYNTIYNQKLVLEYSNTDYEVINISCISDIQLKIYDKNEEKPIENPNSAWYEKIGTYLITASLFENSTSDENPLQIEIINGEPSGETEPIEPTGETEPTGENYYWYIGVENPENMSDIDISNVQTDNTVAGWHEIGSLLSDFVLDTDANPVHVSDTRVEYYVIIPNDLHIYNGININIEDLGFDTIVCNISGYKAFKYNSEKNGGGFYGVRDVYGVILKE